MGDIRGLEGIFTYLRTTHSPAFERIYVAPTYIMRLRMEIMAFRRNRPVRPSKVGE